MSEENTTLKQITTTEKMIKKYESEKQELQFKLKDIENKLNKEKEELKILKNKKYNAYDKVQVGDLLFFKDEDGVEIEIMVISRDNKYIDGLCLTDYNEVVEDIQYSTFNYTFCYVSSLIERIKEDMEWKLVDIKYQDR